jgi:hypothetical protein
MFHMPPGAESTPFARDRRDIGIIVQNVVAEFGGESPTYRRCTTFRSANIACGTVFTSFRAYTLGNGGWNEYGYLST